VPPDPADPRAAPSEPDLPAAPREPRQRWRLILGRRADAPIQTQRELAEAWERAIVGSGLPLARSEGQAARPRISFGAPLPVGMAAHGELIDIVLPERWPVWRVREALERAIPEGWRLEGVHDVWLAGPSLAGRVAAADYRIVLTSSPAVTADAVAGACRALLAARELPRERAKGGGTVRYDLRPLVLDARVVDAGPPVVIEARTRFHPELGTGRPEEVVAALEAVAGVALPIDAIERERLLLAEDIPTTEGP
jgi:radical SAM-linked protein